MEAEGRNARMTTREDFQSHWLKAGGISIPICGINDQINGNWTSLNGIGQFHRGWYIIPLHGNVLLLHFVIIPYWSLGRQKLVLKTQCSSRGGACFYEMLKKCDLPHTQ